MAGWYGFLKFHAATCLTWLHKLLYRRFRSSSVMALSPMQIVFTLGIEIALGKRSAFGSGGFGSTMQRTGIAAVVVGLASFVAGYAMKSGNEKKMQSIDVDRSKRLVDEAETSAEGGNHEGLASRLLSDPVQHR